MGATNKKDMAITEQNTSASKIYAVQDACNAKNAAGELLTEKDATLGFYASKSEAVPSMGSGSEPPSIEELEDLWPGVERVFDRVRNARKDSSTMSQTITPLSGPTYTVLETDLKQAVKRQELRVYYQPIVSLDTGQIAGFEGLVRWQHPIYGLLSPAEFIQVAEETGLIVSIGAWVLRDACRQMQLWHQKFVKNSPLLLCVNFSSKLFQQPDLVEQVCQILKETGLNPQTLKLEITETVVMDNPELVRTKLLQFRALNVQLGIDDFGTGYSSLSYLQKFPVHTLKIDRSFIGRLENDKENLEIVRAIVTLAHNLGLDVVAEGVETEAHLTMLKMLRCEYGQGYLFSKPVDVEHAESLLWSEKAGRAEMPHREAKPAQSSRKGEASNGFWVSPLEGNSFPAEGLSQAADWLRSDFSPANESYHSQGSCLDSPMNVRGESQGPCAKNAPLDPSEVSEGENVIETIHPGAVESKIIRRSASRTGWFGGDLLKPVSLTTVLGLVGILGFYLLSGNQNKTEKTLSDHTSSGIVSPPVETRIQNNAEAVSIREVRSAMASGKYVTPPLANAVYYCNRLLAGDPNNLEAQKLKEESAQKAMAQARQSARSGKSSEARELYRSLLKLSQNESRFPYSTQELKKELQKNEIKTYSVVHDHFVGGCQGKLEFNSYLVSFVPFQDSKDGFSEKLGMVSISADGGKLKITLPNKTYRFKANSGKSKDEQKSRTHALYLELSHRIVNHGTAESNSKG